MYSLKRNCVALYFLICPLELVLNIIFTSSTKYIGILLLGIWLVEMLFNREYATFCATRHTFVLLAWAINELIVTFTIGVISNRTYEYLITYLMMTTLVVICTQEEWNNIDIDLFINAYYLGAILMSLLMLFYGKNLYEGRNTIIIMGHYCDPNQLAASVLPGALIAYDRLVTNSNAFIRLFHLVAMLTVMYEVMSTGSRGGLLGLYVGIVLLIINQLYSNKLQVHHVFLIVVIAIVLMDLLSDRTINRLGNIDTYITGSGRIIIWKSLISSIDEKWIFGHGVGSSIAYYIDYYGKASAVHNTYLLVLYESGIIGLILYTYLLLDLAVNNFVNKKGINVAILTCAMVCSFFLDSLNLRYIWNGIILCIMQYNFEVSRKRIAFERGYRYIK